MVRNQSPQPIPLNEPDGTRPPGVNDEEPAPVLEARMRCGTASMIRI